MAIFPTLCVEKFNIMSGFGRLERQTWRSSGLRRAQGVNIPSLRIPSAALHRVHRYAETSLTGVE
jgi:hypothetical protein